MMDKKELIQLPFDVINGHHRLKAMIEAGLPFKVVINEAVAKNIIEKTANFQRYPHPQTVQRMAEEMMDPFYEANIEHQPIVFSKDGRLLDGMHKLFAIIVACEEKKNGIEIYVQFIDEDKFIEQMRHVPRQRGK